MTSTFRLAILPLLAALALGAPAQAADSWTGGGAQARVAVPRPEWNDLERATYLADGRDDAPRRIYVFMDTNCGYCTKLWAQSRPWVDAGKVQLRYLMVGVISPTSAGKAAAILADRNPAARFDAYERARAFGASHAMGNPNVEPLDPIPPAFDRVLEDHLRMMAGLSLRGTPGIAFRAQNGQVATRPGLSAEDMALIFGAL
ncbi:MAG: thiol:disulfide interchange protein DsbG [Betaproteobacteria bacterium]